MRWSRRDLGLGLLGGMVAAGPARAADPPAPAKLSTPRRASALFALTRNHIWTGVMLEGHGAYPFLIDTGATWYMVDPDLARRLRLSETGNQDLQHTAAGHVLLPIYYLRSIIVGGGVYDQNTLVVGLREDRNDITHGMVPLSDNAVTDLNFDTRQMVTTHELGPMPADYERLDLLNTHGRPNQAAYVGTPGFGRNSNRRNEDGGRALVDFGDGTHSPTAMTTRQPIIEARLDGQPVRLMIDSGEQGGIFLYPDYIRRHGLWDHYPKHLEAVDQTIGGDVKTRIVRPDELAFGRYAFKRPTMTLADPASHGELFNLADGIIGVETLRRLNFINNPGGHVIGFRPSGMFDDIWRYDRAGLSLGRVGGAIQIIDVAEGGPGWKSGLRKGDVVTGWAGADPVKDSGPYFSLLWALQGEPGAQVGVQIANGDGDRPEVVGVTLEERI
jgi:hypothetical protein